MPSPKDCPRGWPGEYAAGGDIGDPAYDVSLPNRHRIVVARLDGAATSPTTVAPLNPGGPLASAGGPSLIQQRHQDARSDPRRRIERKRNDVSPRRSIGRQDQLGCRPSHGRRRHRRHGRASQNPHARCRESLRNRVQELIDDLVQLYGGCAPSDLWCAEPTGETGQCQTVRLRISILTQGPRYARPPAAPRVLAALRAATPPTDGRQDQQGRSKVQLRSCHERPGESVGGAAARGRRISSAVIGVPQ